jgi:Flp pilus assembly pilin Flp
VKGESSLTKIIGAAEYGLIVAGISIAIIAVVNGLGTKLNHLQFDLVATEVGHLSGFEAAAPAARMTIWQAATQSSCSSLAAKVRASKLLLTATICSISHARSITAPS